MLVTAKLFVAMPPLPSPVVHVKSRFRDILRADQHVDLVSFETIPRSPDFSANQSGWFQVTDCCFTQRNSKTN
jgi:hypothetical protein